MPPVGLRLVGVELYYDSLDRARQFYSDLLGLYPKEADQMRYTKLDGGPAFICLERKGSESYPSRDKAVLFFEVPDLEATAAMLGDERIVGRGTTRDNRLAWIAVHDPEGYNVLFMQAPLPDEIE